MDRRLAYVAASRNRYNMKLYAGQANWADMIKKKRPWLFDKYKSETVSREMLLDEIGQRFSQPSDNALAIEQLSDKQIQQALNYEPMEKITLSNDHRYHVAYQQQLGQYLEEHSPDFKAQVNAGVTQLEQAAHSKSRRLNKLKKIVEDLSLIHI